MIYFRPEILCVAVFCISFDNIEYFFRDYYFLFVCLFGFPQVELVFLACGVYGVKFHLICWTLLQKWDLKDFTWKHSHDRVWFCFPVTCQSNCGRGLAWSSQLFFFFLVNIICFHLSNIFDVQFLQWVKPFKCYYNSTLVIGDVLF